MAKKIVIVGGIAGGASTAARLRRMDENAEIIMFEKGKYISYANCGLPYYIGDVIQDRNALLIQTPEKMKDMLNIDVRINSEVISIDKENKVVEIKNLPEGSVYKETYDVLVLSPGSSPIIPAVDGINNPNIFTLWTVPDADKIKNFIDEQKPQKAVVIGGGFIGIEMAENLHERGIEVSIVEMLGQVMNSFDYDMAQIIHGHLASKGINLYLGERVNSFEDIHGRTRLNLQNGTSLEADLVILAAGIKPNGELARNAGLKINDRGGIIVDEYLKTSDENIYALGDAIEVTNYISQLKGMIPLAGPANKQGRIVANNICGGKEKYKGTQGTSVAKIFDLTASSTGLNETMLQQAGKKYGKDYHVALTISKSHAGYYPASMPLTIKLLMDNNGKILGAQAVGYDGVDKRLDVLATTMRLGGTIYDLKELELAYAPPYSSAKDPVNMIGYIAENILEGKMGAIKWDEIADIDLAQVQILDVCEPVERDLGYIENSLHIPLGELRKRLEELDKDKEIAVYCAVGLRGYLAARILSENGFKVRNLLGGYSHYKRAIKDYTTKKDISISGKEKIEMEMENKNSSEMEKTTFNSIKLVACGLQCPGPIMEVNKKMQEINDGDILEVTASDPGFPPDARAWCEKTGNTFIKEEKRDKEFAVYIQKGAKNYCQPLSTKKTDGSSMVVFSGDLDKALASFIIANGAVAMGKEVTMFFTFWGLNILRKQENIKVKKSIIENMFGKMMPKGTGKLPLSKMNMGGMGTMMMKKVMKDKNVNSLDELIKSAMDSGVKIVACTMSMDVMGIKKEELIDGIEFAGVASYLGKTENSNLNLFI